MELPFFRVDAACRDHGVRAPAAFLDSGAGAAGLLNAITQGGFEMQACSWRHGGQGVVLLPRIGEGGITRDWQVCALRHEIAHLNGWPASHPDAHFGLLYRGPSPALPLREIALSRFTEKSARVRRRNTAMPHVIVTEVPGLLASRFP